MIKDYVIKNDRGKATALCIMALSLGIVVALQVLFRLIKDIDAFIAWGVMGGIMIMSSIILLKIIKEPVDIEKSSDGICKQIKDLVVQIGKAIRKNPNLLIGWLIQIFAQSPELIV